MTSNCGAQLLHYLDDFLLVGPSWQRNLSGGHVQNARCWCVTSWASQWPLRSWRGPITTLIFLGIVLDMLFCKAAEKWPNGQRCHHFYCSYTPKHVSSGSSGGLYVMLQLFSHSAPLFHDRGGMPLTANVLPLDYHTPDSFDAAKFNTHSLRIGAASTAARAGLPSDTIQMLVRWRSSAYETYTRHPPDTPIRHQNHGCCPVTYAHLYVPMPNWCNVLPQAWDHIQISNHFGGFTWATPVGIIPWDSHQTLTNISVWDTGRPNTSAC